jgi:hypothetical protein
LEASQLSVDIEASVKLLAQRVISRELSCQAIANHLIAVVGALSRRGAVSPASHRQMGGTQSRPDGSVTERYEFVHLVYRQVLYDRQAPVR